MYKGYGITFDGKGEWNFHNDFARNVITFGVDNSSSSHTDNRKNNFSILGEQDTFVTDGGFGAPEKRFSANFSKAKTNLCLGLNYNCNNSYLLFNGKKSISSKQTIKTSIFEIDFV